MVQKKKNNLNNNTDSSDDSMWLIVILIIIAIVLLIISSGKQNINKNANSSSFNDSIEEAKRKHKRLKALVDKQIALKTKLDKLFKQTYFCVRIVIVLVWFGFLILLYKIGLMTNIISDALSFSQAFLFLLTISYFITYGSIIGLNKYVEIIKIQTENKVYGKHVKLDNRIANNKTDLKKLESNAYPHG